MATYQEQSSGTLPAWNTELMEMLKRAETQSNKGYTPYTGQTVAGLTPQQQAAFKQATASAGNWKPELGQSSNLIRQSANNPLYSQAENLFKTAGAANLAGIGSRGYNQAFAATRGVMNTNLQNLGSAQYNRAANQYDALGGLDLLGAGQGEYGQAQQSLRGALGTDLVGAGSQLYGQAQQGYENAMGTDLANASSGLYGQAQQGLQGAMGLDLTGAGSGLYGQLRVCMAARANSPGSAQSISEPISRRSSQRDWAVGQRAVPEQGSAWSD